MTDATITSIVTGLPATIAALGALIVSFRNGTKTDAVVKKTTHIMETADSNAQKNEEIHQMVNTNLSAVKSELAAQTLRANKLETMLNTIMAEKAGGTRVAAENALSKAEATPPEAAVPPSLLKPNFVPAKPPKKPDVEAEG